jgi:endonuclease III
MFPSTIGTPQDAQGLLNRVFKRTLAKAGLPSVTRFHYLRHTCATLLQLHGIDPNTVKDLLGHANISITLEVDGHVSPNMRDRVAEMMDTILAPSETPNRVHDSVHIWRVHQHTSTDSEAVRNRTLGVFQTAAYADRQS